MLQVLIKNLTACGLANSSFSNEANNNVEKSRISVMFPKIVLTWISRKN